MKSQAERERQPPAEPNPGFRGWINATAAVAATYTYFLIFAQFGLLRAMNTALGEDHSHLRGIMAAMGAAGIAGSVIMARIFSARRARGTVAAGFGLAAVAAGAALLVRGPAGFGVVAALTGLGTGMVTVGLAALLKGEAGAGRLGRCIGWGTGLAYALCNLPGVFTAAPGLQAALGAGVALAGLLAVRGFAPVRDEPGVAAVDLRTAAWVAALFVLVAADAAMFLQIQQTAELRTATWSTPAQLGLNAAVHLAAGVAAGFALDRGRFGVLMAGAALALAPAGALIFRGQGGAAPLYAAAVSAYSAGLVFYPAARGRVGLAAWVYAVAGWTGSAAGIIWVGQGR